MTSLPSTVANIISQVNSTTLAPSPQKSGTDLSLFIEPGWWILQLCVLSAIFYGSYYSAMIHTSNPEDSIIGFSHAATQAESRRQWISLIVLPITASIVLILLFYFMNALHLVLLVMMSIAGFSAVVICFYPFMEMFLMKIRPGLPTTFSIRSYQVQIEIILLIPIGLGVVIAWLVTHYFVLTDFLAICLSAVGIMGIPLPNLKYASILLLIFMVYDVFWVFFSGHIFNSSVMDKVARSSVGLPVLFTFPHVFNDSLSGLGCGDIVLPGLYLALLYRYDTWKGFQGNENNRRILNPRGYFVLGCIGYIIGLHLAILCQIYIFYKSSTGQPALMYLVPGVLIPSMLMVYWRGDFKELWNFNTHSPSQEPDQPQANDKLPDKLPDRFSDHFSDDIPLVSDQSITIEKDGGKDV